MKVTLHLIFLMLFTLNSLAQSNFEWIKTDSIQRTKEQLYSTTKMFIAETWKSSKDVIQNDDKEGGLILIKGKTEVIWKEGKGMLTTFYESWYSYHVTFRMKNSKYQIKIDNVTPDDSFITVGTSSVTGMSPNVQDYTLTPQDSLNLLQKTGGKYILKLYPHYRNVMAELKTDLQSIVDAYSNYLKKSIVSTDF